MSGKFALIIGNTEYTDPGLAQLTAPGRDAEDFSRVLKDREIGVFDDVKILLNQVSSAAIEAIDEFFDQRKPDDLLVLYFSGHGVRDEFGALYLAIKNTNRARLRSTAIRADYVRESMDQSRSKRQVLILDCCNSGAFPQGTKAEIGGAMGMVSAFQGYGRYVLTASDATQFAWEGDKVIGETQNSLFTHFLVKGLEGEADSDGDGKITVDELYDYAYEQISRITPKQTPTKSASKQEGEIVLRQSTRIENIKPVSLPNEIIEGIEDPRPYVREVTVQQLEKLLKGKNLGLARSAREALEKIANQDDSRRVAQLATQVVESIRQAETKADEERKAREAAERIAIQKAEEERLTGEKAEAERKAKEEAEQVLAAQKADEERIAKAKAEEKRRADVKEEANRLMAQKAEDERIAKAKIDKERLAEEKRLIEEKAEAEQKAKEEAERLLAENKVRKEKSAKPILITSQPYFLPRVVTALIIVLASSIGGYYMLQNTALISTPTLPSTREPPTIGITESMGTTQIPTTTNIIPEPGQLIKPADIVPEPVNLIDDAESSGTGPEKRAPYGDSYRLNRFERPFQKDMTYIADMDIRKFSLIDKVVRSCTIAEWQSENSS